MPNLHHFVDEANSFVAFDLRTAKESCKPRQCDSYRVRNNSLEQLRLFLLIRIIHPVAVESKVATGPWTLPHFRPLVQLSFSIEHL